MIVDSFAVATVANEELKTMQLHSLQVGAVFPRENQVLRRIISSFPSITFFLGTIFTTVNINYINQFILETASFLCIFFGHNTPNTHPSGQ